MHSNKNIILPQSFPTLSVIVPIFNEAAILPNLISTLSRQQGIDFELLLIDGGSTDQSIELASEFVATAPFTLHRLSSPHGRGIQMNTGVAAATGNYVLFLHADSTFLDSDALQSGLASLIAAEKSQAGAAIAARFSLMFAPDITAPQRWRIFHTAKARQNRRGAIHGDQGFLMSRSFFNQVGPFDETLPFLEDDRLSDRVFACGRWILLPAEIMTSSRRFEIEGYWRRDLLNVLILTLHQSGYGGWLSGLTATYRAAPEQEKIQIAPALIYLKNQLKSLTCKEQLRFFAAVGRCVSANLWQLKL